MRGALVAGVLLLVQGRYAAQAPTFTVTVDAVRLDVLAVNRGRPLVGLGLDDFELRDNGVVQRIQGVTQEEAALDAVLVLDRSDSVAGEPLDRLREAARTLIGALSRGDRAALVTFSQQVTRPARLTAHLAAVQDAIDRVRPSGATAIFDATYAALLLRDRTPNRTMLLVFSDGLDTASWLMPATVVEFAKQVDTVVYGIMFEPQPRETAPLFFTDRMSQRGSLIPQRPMAAPPPDNVPAFLQAITDATGGRVLRARRDAALREVFLAALRDMKARYVVTYVPAGVERRGWHTIEVRLARRNGTVTARKGYFVP